MCRDQRTTLKSQFSLSTVVSGEAATHHHVMFVLAGKTETKLGMPTTPLGRSQGQVERQPEIH